MKPTIKIGHRLLHRALHVAGRGLTSAAAIALLIPICQSAAQQSPSTAAPGTQQNAAIQPGSPSADGLGVVAAQAQQALDRKDYDAAIPLLKQLEAARPQDALPHFEMGYAYSELKRNEEAAAEYRRALALDPTLPAAHMNLGLVLLDSDPASALESFRRAETLLPDQAQPHYLAGRALERLGKLPDALDEYGAAVKISPKSEPMQFALARALLSAGREADAEKQFREALSLPGDTSQAQLGLAETFVREKKLAEAADAFAAYLAKAPNDQAAHFENAVTLQNLDRYDDALRELDLTSKGAEPSTDALKLRGSIYLQQKRWTEAEAVLRKVAAESPDDADALAWLGRAQIEVRNYPQAAATLQHSLSLDPARIDVLRSLAEADYLSGQYSATLVELEEVEKRDTLRPMDLFFRAICCDKLDKKQDAVTAYEQFLGQDNKSNPDQEWQAQQRLKLLLKELNRK